MQLFVCRSSLVLQRSDLYFQQNVRNLKDVNPFGLSREQRWANSNGWLTVLPISGRTEHREEFEHDVGVIYVLIVRNYVTRYLRVRAFNCFPLTEETSSFSRLKEPRLRLSFPFLSSDKRRSFFLAQRRLAFFIRHCDLINSGINLGRVPLTRNPEIVTTVADRCSFRSIVLIVPLAFVAPGNFSSANEFHDVDTPRVLSIHASFLPIHPCGSLSFSRPQ